MAFNDQKFSAVERAPYVSGASMARSGRRHAGVIVTKSDARSVWVVRESAIKAQIAIFVFYKVAADHAKKPTLQLMANPGSLTFDL